MQLVGDFHIHTVASGDAFGTIQEIVGRAKERNLRGVAITEHGPKMPGAQGHYYYYESLIKNVSEDSGIIIYPGIEANIIDEQGTLDLREKTLNKLEFIIAGFHTFSWFQNNIQANTKALKSCLLRYNIKSIAHLNCPYFEINMDEIIPILIEKKIAVEINNKALKRDRDNWRRFKDIIIKCKLHNVKFLMTSDSHYPGQVGRFEIAEEFAEFCSLEEDDILNTSWEMVTGYLNLRASI